MRDGEVEGVLVDCVALGHLVRLKVGKVLVGDFKGNVLDGFALGRLLGAIDGEVLEGFRVLTVG